LKFETWLLFGILVSWYLENLFMKLVVGLGNPGEKYERVRHNLGFMALDGYIREKYGNPIWLSDKNLKSEVLKEEDLIFAKPQTFMNQSGLALRVLSSVFGVGGEDIIIIHDELDLPLGKIKVRMGGAAAGHHGVESIIKALETDKFIRVRLGIGNLKTKSGEHKAIHVSAEKFVLEPFMHSEKAQVKHVIKQAIKAIELLLDRGLKVAQNQYN